MNTTEPVSPGEPKRPWKALLQDYNRELDAALLTLDPDKVLAVQAKWQPEVAARGRLMKPETLLAGLHKTVTGRTSLPLEFRKQSKIWLEARGLRSLDDGEL